LKNLKKKVCPGPPQIGAKGKPGRGAETGKKSFPEVLSKVRTEYFERSKRILRTGRTHTAYQACLSYKGIFFLIDVAMLNKMKVQMGK
jgi:hypothetical protein